VLISFQSYKFYVFVLILSINFLVFSLSFFLNLAENNRRDCNILCDPLLNVWRSVDRIKQQVAQT